MVVAVVALGCANNIMKQIAAKPLHSYSYMLGLATAVAYVPLYGLILVVLVVSKVVPRHQMDFVWRCSLQPGIPILGLFAVAALGDTLGDVIGMICTPYVTGPVHSLLSNCTPMFIAVLSMLFLRKRYSLAESLGLLGVLVAVLLGIVPTFEGGSSSTTQPFFAVVLGGSCLFNAIAFMVKELLFERYTAWFSTRNVDDEVASGLNIFVMNTHASLFQLPFTLLCMPLNVALGQTHGEGIVPYMREAIHCEFASDATACGPDGVHGDLAGTCTIIYVVFNILWNISILMSVKYSGALTTFVALKAIFPVSTLLFAYVDWPLIGRTDLNWLVWLSVALILPSIALYQWATGEQQKRYLQHPSLAACCWPLGRSRVVLAVDPL